MKKINHHAAGFTLLEILVALTVFAILATITSSAMYNAFNTRSKVTAQADRLNTLEMTMALLQPDTQQIVERSIRGNELHVFPPFTGLHDYLEFTRGGEVNPSGQEQRSTLKRIAYLCRNHQLIRRSWEALDTTNRNQYQDKILFDHLNQCQFSYLAHNHQVLTEWREYALKQNQRKESLPTAIQFSMNLSGWGKISLLFIIPEALYAEE